MTTPSRLITLTVLLLFISAATLWTSARGKPPRIELPKTDIHTLPSRLGSWSASSDTPPESMPKTGSAVAVERVYQDLLGHKVSLILAVYDNYFDGRGVIVTHCPDICYPANGYTIADDQALQLPVRGEESVSARLLTVEREQERLRVLFWYQLGDGSFASLPEMRNKIWSMRGKSPWPSLVKVMLQVPASEPRQAEQQLRDIATPIALWLKEHQ